MNVGAMNPCTSADTARVELTGAWINSPEARIEVSELVAVWAPLQTVEATSTPARR
jgi:hypothetical protein